MPHAYASGQRLDRHQALHAELMVVLAADEVVHDPDLVPDLGQVQCSRPAQVSIAAKYQYPHAHTPSIVDTGVRRKLPTFSRSLLPVRW